MAGKKAIETDVKTVRLKKSTIKYYTKKAKIDIRKVSETMRIVLEDYQTANPIK